ncbi:uncharacterized protein CLUP02_17295 [Colletotrichum lupini]|uniref:Uncharacterized protein n=1 Tax=Colletotrichum lupini TaxID=145971 RepID=A0A9Q8WAM8_9PEZI|nr:uncharacterized protein CLUP02_17295 [Colletotrichum lupini]UQC75787.1 hypothetical protein CLUP02_17295 [Colletotrichum lupini]
MHRVTLVICGDMFPTHWVMAIIAWPRLSLTLLSVSFPKVSLSFSELSYELETHFRPVSSQLPRQYLNVPTLLPCSPLHVGSAASRTGCSHSLRIHHFISNAISLAATLYKISTFIVSCDMKVFGIIKIDTFAQMKLLANHSKVFAASIIRHQIAESQKDVSGFIRNSPTIFHSAALTPSRRSPSPRLHPSTGARYCPRLCGILAAMNLTVLERVQYSAMWTFLHSIPTKYPAACLSIPSVRVTAAITALTSVRKSRKITTTVDNDSHPSPTSPSGPMPVKSFAHIPATSLGASSLSLPRAPSRLRPTILAQNAANPRRLHLSRPCSYALNASSQSIYRRPNDLMHSTARRNVGRPLGSENGLRLGPETPHLRALAQFSLANIPVVPPKARYLQKRGVLSLRQRAFAGESSRIELSMAIPSSPAMERRRLLGLTGLSRSKHHTNLKWLQRLPGNAATEKNAFTGMDQQQSRCRYCSSNEEDRHRGGYAASNDGRYRYAHMINSRGYRLARHRPQRSRDFGLLRAVRPDRSLSGEAPRGPMGRPRVSDGPVATETAGWTTRSLEKPAYSRIQNVTSSHACHARTCREPELEPPSVKSHAVIRGLEYLVQFDARFEDRADRWGKIRSNAQNLVVLDKVIKTSHGSQLRRKQAARGTNTSCVKSVSMWHYQALQLIYSPSRNRTRMIRHD